jgi:hypothetical protein
MYKRFGALCRRLEALCRRLDALYKRLGFEEIERVSASARGEEGRSASDMVWRLRST